jgi:exosortase C (VPDSG-CTERM-specific)
VKTKTEAGELPEADPASAPVRYPPTEAIARQRRNSGRFRMFVFFLIALSLVFLSPLLRLFFVAAGSEVLSYILLIPFVFLYLIYIRRDQLPADSRRSFLGGGILLTVGLFALALAFSSPHFSARTNSDDHLALTVFAFVCFVASGGFVILGWQWMRSLVFPFAFLIFLVPLPNEAIDGLERASQIASADAADILFTLSGTPILRDGMVFQLPGMVIQVAQECSGIRSSLVLFITSLVAAHLFLRSAWTRIVLVAFVIPLGILRNGLRILMIGLLCVHYGPAMITSVIHRRGGPFFFALSLIPLFVLLVWLRKVESRRRGGRPPGPGSPELSQSAS